MVPPEPVAPQPVPPQPDTPAAAWAELAAGNARFAADRAERPHADAGRRRRLSTGQQPFALVLGCSDSRVPPELVLDRGLGEVFVVRTAGHVLDEAVLGSVEFAVGVLRVPLLLVLGHDSCGAVAAALRAHDDGQLPAGFVGDVVEKVLPGVRAAADRGATAVDDVVREHAVVTARGLLERSEPVRSEVEAGRLGVVAARYDLAEGVVEPLWWRGPDDLLGRPASPGTGTGARTGRDAREA